MIPEMLNPCPICDEQLWWRGDEFRCMVCTDKIEASLSKIDHIHTELIFVLVIVVALFGGLVLIYFQSPL